MNFVEFLEAITRMADKFSPPPYGSNEVEQIPYEKRLNYIIIDNNYQK